VIKLSNLAANTEADALGRLLDGGTLRIFTGPRPANVETAISKQTLLVTLGFGDPAFPKSVNGMLVANDIQDGVIVEDGKAEWFRAYTSTGRAVFDGTVTKGPSGDMDFPQVNFQKGLQAGVASFTYEVQT
jgi:hypothetical protein